MTDKIRKDQVGLRDLGINGYRTLFIKAKDTEENEAILESFKAFAKIEAGDNYTLALKLLLNSYSDDAKYDILADRLIALEDEVHKVETPKEAESTEGMF